MEEGEGVVDEVALMVLMEEEDDPWPEELLRFPMIDSGWLSEFVSLVVCNGQALMPGIAAVTPPCVPIGPGQQGE